MKRNRAILVFTGVSVFFSMIFFQNANCSSTKMNFSNSFLSKSNSLFHSAFVPTLPPFIPFSQYEDAKVETVFKHELLLMIPHGIVYDIEGNLYITNPGLKVINKISTTGEFSVYAGAAWAPGYANGDLKSARFESPTSLAFDASGNLYISDRNYVIRKITPAGQVSLFAGQPGKMGNQDGNPQTATLSTAYGMNFDHTGNLWIADTLNHTIRKIAKDGSITTVAGSAGVSGSHDGPGRQALFNSPTGVTFDPNGNLFVSDLYNHTVRKIFPSGDVTTYAGKPLTAGHENGSLADARFREVHSITSDQVGNLYIGDRGSLRMISSGGIVTSIAGEDGTGSRDGKGIYANFKFIRGLAINPSSGDMTVSDSSYSMIRKVQLSDGNTTTTYSNLQHHLTSMIVNSKGKLLISNTQMGSIQELQSDGTFLTLKGTENAFKGPNGMTFDRQGNLFIADYYMHRIYKLDSSNTLSIFAGSTVGNKDGIGLEAEFNSPVSIAIDSNSNLFVVEGSNRIRKITPSGVVSTFAGDPAMASGYKEGVGTQARFNNPNGIVIDSKNNLYVSDNYNDVIRKISPAGVVSTFSGNGIGRYNDGPALSASFYRPMGLAIDANDNIYVADSMNCLVRKITPTGNVVTIAGKPGVSGLIDGLGSTALLSNPWDIAIDSQGILYLNENTMHIAKITPKELLSQ